ncbi:MAG: YcaO-like family protein [Desulfobacterales bacterium]|nr:MAG: YcaO-like family protein [Desulfobacterales bacterium]
MEAMNSQLQSRIALTQSPKTHTVGLDKAISPAETIRNIKKVLQGIELELVRDITRIDAGRLDIPVYVCRAGKDCNTPSPRTMGKGPSPEQSEASALMELVERFSHANFPRPECHLRSTLRDLVGETIPFENLLRVSHDGATPPEEDKREFVTLPFAWVPAYSLVQQRDFLIPYEWFADIQGTNGLSAGNTLEETILQGLCEVVERHVCAVVTIAQKPVPTIDLTTVRDPVAQELIDKFARNRIQLVCKDFSLDTGIPTVAGIAFDPATFPNSEIVYCAGTATHPEKALIRTLTEIQQMAVDYFKQDYYAGGILPKFKHWQESYYLFDKSPPVPIQSLPDLSSDDLREEIENCTAALNRIALQPLVINISHPILQVPAVFVVMPGAAQYETAAYRLNTTYYLGRRLRFIGQLEKAMERFRLSIERHPLSALHCTLEIANCLKHMQRWEEAIEAYKATLRCQPDRAMQHRIFNALALCSDRLKESKGRPAAPSDQ